MPRLVKKLPKYRLHKASNQAVVSISGKAVYLGKYGSPESHSKYQELLSNWHSAQTPQIAEAVQIEVDHAELNSITAASLREKRRQGQAVSIAELILVYERHTHQYYRKHGKLRRHVISGDYTSFLKRMRYFWDAASLLWFLKRSGVSLKEMVVFLYEVGRLWCIPSRQVIAELSRLQFSQYVSGDRVSPGFENIFFRVAEILVAAKSYASAGVVSRTLLEWFVTPFLVGKHVRHAVSEFDGSTSDALIEPWANWLQSKGVRFRTARVSDIDVRAAKVQSISLVDDESPIDADIYVLAVQHNIADALLSEEVKRYIPGLVDFPNLGEEWAHSVQFQLSEIPASLAAIGTASIAVLDSPWAIGYRIYSKETWREPDWNRYGLPDHAGILTATISNTKRPGIVHDLPFLRCNREQILEEVIAQANLREDLSVSQGDLGLDIWLKPAYEIDESEHAGYAMTEG